jgi:hypothetical protein
MSQVCYWRCDFDALLAVLDPEVVLRADPAAMPSGASTEVRCEGYGQ